MGGCEREVGGHHDKLITRIISAEPLLMVEINVSIHLCLCVTVRRTIIVDGPFSCVRSRNTYPPIARYGRVFNRDELNEKQN